MKNRRFETPPAVRRNCALKTDRICPAQCVTSRDNMSPNHRYPAHGGTKTTRGVCIGGVYGEAVGDEYEMSKNETSP